MKKVVEQIKLPCCGKVAEKMVESSTWDNSTHSSVKYRTMGSSIDFLVDKKYVTCFYCSTKIGKNILGEI